MVEHETTMSAKRIAIALPSCDGDFKTKCGVPFHADATNMVRLQRGETGRLIFRPAKIHDKRSMMVIMA
jgi:hypothetical protein